ncbi:MAG: (p)ppGpp synthetase [Rhodospirillales bacterium RIFCSPLOWO2_12_FULL_58_28]|nr:MAG: (p)ppGpp synthetase [Rhodospirillales bacterium RIFCSPLOWO2_02_FULL_58_16]OHC79038.1 MAG: (p)ppGpp synthetase [Rhodospirillales bacterium RIFCSPLOWO2_12_FULL_58_28]
MKQEDSKAISAVAAFIEKRHEFQIFMDGISQWFLTHPKLRHPDFPFVHSVKARLKNNEHLKEKIIRKSKENIEITKDNIFDEITDLAGVRVLHLYQDQFRTIHEEFLVKVNKLHDWYLPEHPKAYTWDPESIQFFENQNIKVEIKESFYTSVHYLVKPREDSLICCEIQVRTLFEEIWGEIDHVLNYPRQSLNLSCREQLLVLAKLVGAGSRLADSIFRSSTENNNSKHWGDPAS